MFWGKKSEKGEAKREKLSGPQEIPGPVQNHLAAERKIALDTLRYLKAVVRKSPNPERALNIRIFDEAEALAKKVQVNDYTTLDAHPDLVIYEGQFDEGSNDVKLEEKKKVNWDTKIFSEAEIHQQIEALNEPRGTVFFYTARGSAHGGPLGMGAAVVERNPDYPGKKQKKYNVYPADVIEMQPVKQEQKLFDTDNAKDLARWIKERHHKRMY